MFKFTLETLFEKFENHLAKKTKKQAIVECLRFIEQQIDGELSDDGCSEVFCSIRHWYNAIFEAYSSSNQSKTKVKEKFQRFGMTQSLLLIKII